MVLLGQIFTFVCGFHLSFTISINLLPKIFNNFDIEFVYKSNYIIGLFF